MSLRIYATSVEDGQLYHARHWFIKCASMLLTGEWTLRRNLGICCNLDHCISNSVEEITTDGALCGYDLIAALCGGDTLEVFGHVHEGRWGGPGSDGDVFRQQWLSERITEARCMTDAEWIQHLRDGGIE